MTYEAVLTQVRAAPEACLDEISQIISYVVYRYKKEIEKKDQKNGILAEFYGAMPIDGDPLEIQKELRNEWN